MIRELPNTERPYEKCEEKGAASLSDAELLAVILRSGSKGESALSLANRILYKEGNNGLLNLHQVGPEKLMELRGVGRVKAIQLACLSEISKRMSRLRFPEGPSFSSPKLIATYYMETMRHEKQEHVKLLMLNSKSRLLGETTMFKGSVNSSVVNPRELFIEALQRNAVFIILLHNHPSGDPTPSKEDIMTTIRIKEAGALVGVELLDHIIIGDCSYSSLREMGQL